MLRHYFFSLLTTAVTHAVLACFVYFKGFRRLTNRTYAGYSMAIAVWSVGEAFGITSADRTHALWLWRLNHIGVIFIPIFFVHFVTSLLSDEERRQRGILIGASYAIGLVFLILNLTGVLIAEVVPKFHFNYFINSTPIYLIFFFSWVGWAIYGLKQLFQLYFGASPAKKNQLSYFCISMLIAYLGGIPNFLPTFDIEIPFLMPFGTYAIPIYGFFAAYAIVAYRLMDIEVIIKKTLVFTGLFAMAMAIVVMVTTLTQNYLSRYFAISPMASTMISVVLAILLYDPTRRVLINATDRFLFQRKEDIKIMLKRLSEDIITILELDRAGRAILSTLEQSLRLHSGAILIKNETERRYEILNAFGVPRQDLAFEKSHPLIELLIERGGTVNLEDSKEKAVLSGESLKVFEDLNVVIAIPLVFQRDLIGVLFLGKKKSDQEFMQDEIDYFPTVASQVALALRNARLYDEQIQRRQEIEEANRKLKEMEVQLIQMEKRRVLAEISGGIGHEIRHALTPFTGFIYQVGYVKRDFEKLVRDDSLPPPVQKIAKEGVETLEKNFKTISQATERILTIVDTLRTFVKGRPFEELKEEEKPFKMDKIDFELLMKLALEHSHYLHVLKNITVAPTELVIEEELPILWGDLNLLLQVFDNLFSNAYDAMKNSPEKKIAIRASPCREDARFVQVEFKDTGSGIPQEIKERVWEYLYSTKGESGSGIGLFWCKKIVEEFHGGKIWFDSEVGKGTTFFLTLPVFKGQP